MVECAVTDSPALNVLKEAETAQEVTSTTSTLMATMTSAAAPPPGATLATLMPAWECDSASKYSPIKVEPIEDIVLAELKPPIYDSYEAAGGVGGGGGATTLTGIDSVLTTAAANNNSKSVTDLNLASPPPPASASSFSSSVSTASSDVTSSGSPAAAAAAAAAMASTAPLTGTTLTPVTATQPSGGQQTQGGGPGNKWEQLDFSKDAFDDLGSVIGMSIADSTVPNIEDALDWIDIQPLKLNGELSLELTPAHPAAAASLGSQPVTVVTTGGIPTGLLSTTAAASLSCHRVNSVINPYPNSISVTATGGTSTLQSLLQGNLHPAPASSLAGKVTQLQPREAAAGAPTLTTLTTPLPPPPYSILQNRLTHGPPASQVAVPPPPNSHVIKVDSTYDLMKAEGLGSAAGSAATSPTGSSTGYLYADSTQSPLNHVTTSADQSTSDGAALQQRLSELGGLKIKKKVRKAPPGGGGGGGGAASPAPGDMSPLDPNAKKMMHHCQICHRGFLNKSNIKVHLRTHTGEKPFQCEHCSKAFRQKAHLLKHMSIHKRISRD